MPEYVYEQWPLSGVLPDEGGPVSSGLVGGGPAEVAVTHPDLERVRYETQARRSQRVQVQEARQAARLAYKRGLNNRNAK